MPEQTLPQLPATPPEVMNGAEPIFIDQGNTGILFFHGFTGSPYEGRDLAYHFASKGYAVWVPLIPGHGTKPDDLEGISFKTWLETAEQYYLAMKSQYKTVIVAGQSMGGALALHVAANFAVDGLVTMAAAIFVKDWRLPFLPLAKQVLRFYYKSKGPDIRDKAAKAKSASYPYYPLTSLTEFLHLIEHVDGELPAVNAPCLLVHSRRDHTITYENLAHISGKISSTKKKLLTLENSYHVISVDGEKQKIFNQIELFINEIQH